MIVYIHCSYTAKTAGVLWTKWKAGPAKIKAISNTPRTVATIFAV
ncbi:MAG: hypothetical protein U9N08_06865 [Candidatus Caldatribacteriota bacterium]|nr:hypothetical protein [Candidatus Caldatribacteriota bacterium]